MSLLGALLLAWWWLTLGSRIGESLLAQHSPSTRLASYLALGSLVSALLAGLLSLAGGLNSHNLRFLLAAGLLLTRPAQEMRLLRESFWQLPQPGFLMAGLLCCLGALVPTTHSDTQIYHYTLPRLYLEQGGLYWTKTGVSDGHFHLFHLILSWPLALAGELCANLTGPLFWLILTLALVGCLPSSASPRLMLALVVSSPILILQSFGGLADLPACAFTALSLLFWRRQQNGWAALWMGAAMSTRLNCAPALLSLCLASLVLERSLRPALLFLLTSSLFCLPWLVLNGIHTGHLLYPLGVRWKWAPLLTSRQLPGPPPVATSPGLAGAVPGTASLPPAAAPVTRPYPGSLLALSFHSPTRAWQDCLSPLLLGGMLLCWVSPRAGGRPNLPIWLCLALQAGLALPDPRYSLPGGCWLLIPACVGWSEARAKNFPAARLCLGMGLLSGMLPGLASLWPRLQVTLQRQSPQQYIRQRLPVYDAYLWLASQPYRKILLTDLRAYRCPRPFFLYMQADLTRASQPYGEESLAGLRQAILAEHCDLVLWNLEKPELMKLTHGGDFNAALEDPQEWMTAHPNFDFHEWRCRVLYHLLRGGRVVYRQGPIVAVEWPPNP